MPLPPKAKALKAGLDCELDKASLPVDKSPISVQLDPSQISVIATAPPPPKPKALVLVQF